MDIHLLLVPYDSAQRGTRLGAGPERIVGAGLPEALERRGHHVRATTIDPPVDRWRAEIGTAFQLAAALAGRVRDARASGAFPVVLTGNCMATLGVVSGLGPGTAVLWFDAHADYNTPETTLGGFLDGMALATTTGRCWSTIAKQIPGFHPVPEENVWLIGARDIDPLEQDALDRSSVRRLGVDAVGTQLADLVTRELGSERLHMHLDLDVLDSGDGRANEYAAPHGVRAASLIAACHSLGESTNLAALTVSAYDPSFDDDGRVVGTAIDAIVAVVDGVSQRTQG